MALRVTGAFDISDGTGAKFDLAGRSTISFRRCGQRPRTSRSCDGAHKYGAAFKSDEKARALPPPPKPRA